MQEEWLRGQEMQITLPKTCEVMAEMMREISTVATQLATHKREVADSLDVLRKEVYASNVAIDSRVRVEDNKSVLDRLDRLEALMSPGTKDSLQQRLEMEWGLPDLRRLLENESTWDGRHVDTKNRLDDIENIVGEYRTENLSGLDRIDEFVRHHSQLCYRVDEYERYVEELRNRASFLDTGAANDPKDIYVCNVGRMPGWATAGLRVLTPPGFRSGMWILGSR